MTSRLADLSPRVRARVTGAAGGVVAAAVIAVSVAGLNSSVLPYRGWPVGEEHADARRQVLAPLVPRATTSGSVAAPALTAPLSTAGASRAIGLLPRPAPAAVAAAPPARHKRRAAARRRTAAARRRAARPSQAAATPRAVSASATSTAPPAVPANVPPGLAKKPWHAPPGLAKKPASHVPPGRAKKTPSPSPSLVPAPAHAPRRSWSRAKRTPPGHGGIAPGQAKKRGGRGASKH